MIPNSATLQQALIEVLIANPGGLSSKDIDNHVAAKLDVKKQDQDLIRSGTRTEFAYRMAWERTHAKAKGLISKGEKRNWKITELGKQKRSN